MPHLKISFHHGNETFSFIHINHDAIAQQQTCLANTITGFDFFLANSRVWL